jgi:hypothetical protein
MVDGLYLISPHLALGYGTPFVPSAQKVQLVPRRAPIPTTLTLVVVVVDLHHAKRRVQLAIVFIVPKAVQGMEPLVGARLISVEVPAMQHRRSARHGIDLQVDTLVVLESDG